MSDVPSAREIEGILTAAQPLVEAFGLGGSMGFGTADELSDLDYFVLISNNDVQEAASVLRRAIVRASKARELERGFITDFGYHVGFIFDDDSTISIFLNSMSTLRATTMARKTRVLFDTTGRFTVFHDRIRSEPRQSVAIVAEHASTEFLIELLKIQKFAVRGESLPIVHKLMRLRLLALAMYRYSLGQPYSTHDADKRISTFLSDRLVDSFMATVTTGAPHELGNSLNFLCEFFLKSLEKTDGAGEYIGSDYHARVDKIRLSVKSALR